MTKVRPTRVMRDGGWGVWDPRLGDYRLENSPPAPPPQEPMEVRLTHPRGVDPAASYRLVAYLPQREAGQPPESREVTVAGDDLIRWLFDPNRYCVGERFIGEAPLVPLLDVLAATTDLHWCRIDEAKVKVLGSGGFVLLTEAGYIAPYGPHASSTLAGSTWSAWRRRVESEAAKAKIPSPLVESEESAPTEAPPRRRSPWRRPKEVSADE